MYDDYHGIHVGHSKAFSLLMSISTFLFILFASIAIGTHLRSVFFEYLLLFEVKCAITQRTLKFFYKCEISACALYYLAELAEEYASVSKQIVKYALYVRASSSRFINQSPPPHQTV